MSGKKNTVEPQAANNASIEPTTSQEFRNEPNKQVWAKPQVDADGEVIMKPSVVQVQAQRIFDSYKVISFRNRAMYLVDEPFPHYIPLTKERFDRIAYHLLAGPTRSRVSDVFSLVCNTAVDMTSRQDLILFGRYDIAEGAEQPENHASSVLTVWDTDELSMSHLPPTETVWRSPYAKIGVRQLTGEDYPERLPFIMQLAGGDEDLYDDIMQSIAPIVMKKKPDGVVWWIGDGANGKSTLMDALYRIFPGQLASLTVKALTDGRDTPMLNGQLANVVKESSESRIDDTEIYKAIGTHEDFSVHKFHSQDTVTIMGNMHHIFSGNSIPAFNDKGFSARRRTFIIPFNERFESDPTFEEKTFTPEFFGRLIMEICKYAVRIKRQGYRYKWSAKTLGAKANYDTEANTAENYAADLIVEGVVGFDNFGNVRTDYENWCREEGQVPLGVQNMRRAIQGAGFEQISVRTDAGPRKSYRLPGFREGELQKLSLMRPGLYTVHGFQPEKPVKVPDFEGREKTTSIIGDKW